MKTMLIYQRMKGARRSACVGFLEVPDRADKVTMREDLRRWLHDRGIPNPPARLYSLRPEPLLMTQPGETTL